MYSFVNISQTGWEGCEFCISQETGWKDCLQNDP